MSNIPSLLEMLQAGLHFGHQKSRWHPKMEQYLYGVRNGVHVIDLDKTVEALAIALDYVKNLSAKGKVVLFVGTKRQARSIIKNAAESCGAPYLTERWIGGLITNFDEFKRRMKKYKGLKEMFVTGEIEKYTKKEQVSFKKEVEKMDRYLSGLVSLEKVPDAIYIADLRVEKTALMEAHRVNVPMIAVCDSNVDPTKVEYPIPANDDAVNSIKLIADLMAEAIKEGKALFEKAKAEGKITEEKAPAHKTHAVADKFENKNSTSKAAPAKTERRALRKEVSV
ncbi:MAG: 30S ribosomal protein S2 [Patescibacteria group bacterium]|jgi:small subunit ribosomal protein S2